MDSMEEQIACEGFVIIFISKMILFHRKRTSGLLSTCNLEHAEHEFEALEFTCYRA